MYVCGRVAAQVGVALCLESKTLNSNCAQQLEINGKKEEQQEGQAEEEVEVKSKSIKQPSRFALIFGLIWPANPLLYPPCFSLYHLPPRDYNLSMRGSATSACDCFKNSLCMFYVHFIHFI